MKYVFVTQTFVNEATRHAGNLILFGGQASPLSHPYHHHASLHIVKLVEIKKIYIKRIVRDESGKKEQHCKMKDKNRSGLR
jgi:hypothetical protein